NQYFPIAVSVGVLVERGYPNNSLVILENKFIKGFRALVVGAGNNFFSKLGDFSPGGGGHGFVDLKGFGGRGLGVLRIFRIIAGGSTGPRSFKTVGLREAQQKSGRKK